MTDLITQARELAYHFEKNDGRPGAATVLIGLVDELAVAKGAWEERNSVVELLEKNVRIHAKLWADTARERDEAFKQSHVHAAQVNKLEAELDAAQSFVASLRAALSRAKPLAIRCCDEEALAAIDTALSQAAKGD